MATHTGWPAAAAAAAAAAAPQVWNLTKATLPQCRATCSKFFYPLAIISTDFSCRCSWAVPEEARRLMEWQCQPGGSGVAVFYMNQGMHRVFRSPGHTVYIS
jgi:hypothetical protein